MNPSSFNPYPPVVAAPMGWGAPPPPPLPPPREVPFRFTGDAKEYFRIWIVNVALTILTLGIYSAWAKVRTKQYFYRNTWLEDATFEYLADPIRILKGRLIIAAALGLVFSVQFYSLVLYIALAILLLLLTPFVVVKSLAFNARNSAYRNVRFSFLGNVGEGAGVYAQALLFYVLTCGAGYPYGQWRMTDFVIRRHLFGDERFEWATTASEYFRVFLMAFLMSIPVYGVAFVALMAMESAPEGPVQYFFLATGILAYVGLLIPAAYTKANLANANYNGLSIGQHRLCSDQRALDLFKLYFINLLGIVFSLGLLFPWAKIRLARYRAERLKLIAVGPLLAGNYDMAGKTSALGDAATDLGDYDLDFGA